MGLKKILYYFNNLGFGYGITSLDSETVFAQLVAFLRSYVTRAIRKLFPVNKITPHSIVLVT